MSTALYRRYRPDTFADVIGQDHVTAPLITALGKNAVSHAYLFSGPRGCGKTTSARILARCLNCAQGPTGSPCGECDSCQDLATGGPGALDVIEIDAASHGGVDDARDLRERATFAPVRDRYKIFIIDEAHMVTAAGFNALLKIVEEPPEHIKFIFATTEPDKVIGTIRSRTHHYPFRLVPPEPLLEYLNSLCERENVQVAPGVLHLVIRAGGGSVRDTLSVLDQLIAGSTDTGLDYDRAVALLGFTHATLLDDVVDSVAAADGSTAFNVVDRVVQSGQDPRRFVEDLLERLRDLIVVKSVPDSPGAILRGIPEAQIRLMQDQAEKLGAAELSRAADIIAQALTDMVGATSPRLHLELLTARLLLPHAEKGHSSLAARLERLERRLDFANAAGMASAGQTPDAEPETDPAAESQPAAGRPAAAQEQSSHATPAAEQGSTSGTPDPAPPSSEPASTPPAQPEAQAAARSGDPSEAEPAGAPEPQPAQTPGRPAEPAPQAASPQSEANTAVAGGSGSVEMMRRAWPDIVDALKSQSRMLWMLVKGNVAVADFDGTTLALSFSNEGARSTFVNRHGEQALHAAIEHILGMQVSFEFVTGGAPPAADSSPKGERRQAPAPRNDTPSQGDAASPAPQVNDAPAASQEPSPQPSADGPPADGPPAHQYPVGGWSNEPAEPDVPAWVEEEVDTSAGPTSETPPPAPSHHPAWDGATDGFIEEPPDDEAAEDMWGGSDDAGASTWPAATASDASAADAAAGDTSASDASASDVSASDVSAFHTFSSPPPVPAFARSSGTPTRSHQATPSGSADAPQTVDPGAGTGSAASPAAAGHIAGIRERLAQRRDGGSTEDQSPHQPGPGQRSAAAAAPAEGPTRAGSAASADSPSRGAAAPPTAEVEDIASDDDVEIEHSGVFGRRAIERILDGTLMEEQRLNE